jgi:predicted glutamine amidotransferase
MCGLVGVVGKIGLKEEQAFQTLLFLDLLRGQHSTGFVGIRRKTYNSEDISIDVEKKATDAVSFMKQSANFQKNGMTYANYIALLGHNRYATVGSVNDANAHPFVANHVIGMHNGTLDKYSSTDKNLDKYDVDSEALFNSLSEKPLRDTMKEVSGAYSLVWIDKEQNRIHFLRNSERPLSFCYVNDRKTLLYASESWMLIAAIDRHDLQEESEIFNTKPNIHYFWDYGSYLSVKNEQKLTLRYEKEEVEAAPKKSRPVTRIYTTSTTYQNNYAGYQRAASSHDRVEGFVSKFGVGHAKIVPFYLVTPPDDIISQLTSDKGFVKLEGRVLLEDVDSGGAKIRLSGGPEDAKKFVLDHYNYVLFASVFSVQPEYEESINATTYNAQTSCSSVTAAMSWDTIKPLTKETSGSFKTNLKDRYLDLVGYNKDKKNSSTITTFTVGGRVYTSEEYVNLLKKGCSWCSESVFNFEDYHRIAHTSTGEIICHSCRPQVLRSDVLEQTELSFPTRTISRTH